MNSTAILRLLAIAFAVLPTAASAHVGTGDGHDALHGFMHPLGGLDHVLAMVAVGIFAAQLGGRALWLVPGSFVAAMIAGGAIGMAGIQLPVVETMIALSVVALGAVISLGIAMPLAAAMALVAGAAIFHGYAHGVEMPANASGYVYGLGFVAATVLLHLAGIALGRGINRIGASTMRVARTTGAAIAVAGIALLAWAI